MHVLCVEYPKYCNITGFVTKKLLPFKKKYIKIFSLNTANVSFLIKTPLVTLLEKVTVQT